MSEQSAYQRQQQLPAGMALACRTTAIIFTATLLTGCLTLPGEQASQAPAPDTSTATTEGNAGDSIVTLDRVGAKQLQIRLAGQGFDPGPADGVIGPRTVAAIEQYQSANHMPVTGQITAQLLAHLEPAPVPPPAPTRPGPTRPGPINLTRDELPAYQPGTTFIYSNGIVERVSAIDGPAVQWVRDDGTKYTATANFLLPWSYWTSSYERGKAAIADAAGPLWPLREGAEVSYAASSVVQRKADGDATEERVDSWRCRNDGERTITVPAGTFETVVFQCRRGAEPDASDLVRTWYYAKDVRHFVRFVENVPGHNSARNADLVAVRPGAPAWPPIVRAALARAIVHTLEAGAGDKPMPWTSSAVNTSVTIEAGDRVVGQDGVSCRRFVQVWSDAAGRRHYPALACQTRAEHWEIPGLETSADGSLEPAGEVS